MSDNSKIKIFARTMQRKLEDLKMGFHFDADRLNSEEESLIKMRGIVLLLERSLTSLQVENERGQMELGSVPEYHSSS